MHSRKLVLVLALAGCERGHTSEAAPSSAAGPVPKPMAGSSPTGETGPPPAWLGFVATHWLPGPDDPQKRGDPNARAALEARCPSCHAPQTEHWRSSQHASAWSGEAFQAAFAIEPLPFCQGCHAPEFDVDVPLAAAEPNDEHAGWAATTGVGCVTCHVEPGEARIWTAGEALEPELERGCALPIARSPAFAGPQACGRCHQFTFPDAPPGARPPLMQSTLAEHAASAESTRSCNMCHMPEGRTHAFPGAYDPAMLRRSLDIEVQREARAMVISLGPGAVGHAVPTGDLFRRLELSVLALDAEGHEQLLDQRWLGRRFGLRARGDGLEMLDELADERVGPGGRTLRFELAPDQLEQTLRWRVVHQRVAHPEFDGEVEIEGQLEIASGLVEPP